MKRLIILLFAVLLLAGCGSTAAQSAPSRTAPAAAQTSQPFDGSDIRWRSTPDSTCFSYIGYDSGNEKLAVIFRSNESRAYVYSDFTAADWADFTAADSLGKYYNTYIKGYYDSERYDDAAALRKKGK